MELTMAQAEALMRPEKCGYLVSFEKRNSGILESGYYPIDAPFKTEADAWGHAERFAINAPSAYVNIYVVNAWDYVPVAGYAEKMMRRHR